MSKLYRFFRSVRLAVVLLLVITGLSILATLIPQGRGEEYYRASYAPGMADLILWTRFDRFSTSVLFLAPLALFVVNLGVCTVHRMTTRGKSGASRRHGPDLIHIGLLILAVGGVASTLLRKEAAFSMGAGDSVDVSGGYRLELLAFDTQRYDSGLPKDWISTVRVTQGDKVLRESFAIEVNRPLRLGLLSVYQTTYETEVIVHVSDASGATYTLQNGEGVRVGESVHFLAGAERGAGGEYRAQFEVWKGEKRVEVLSVGAGGSVGDYRIDRVSARDLTGLTAVRDPGYIPVLAALIVGAVGLALTFVQKRKEEKA